MAVDMPTAQQMRAKVPQGQIHNLQTVPAPTKGLNTTGQVADMPPTDALEMDNFIAQDLGVQVRSGWYEYATNIGGGATHPIRTVMAYNGTPTTALANPLATSQLFAVVDGGIYYIEGGGNFNAASPAIALSGASNAGTMSFAMFTAAGGGQYLVACSEIDGGYLYDGVAWMKMVSTGSGPGHITGVNPALFAQVCVWKQRLMFTLRGSTQVYFLPVGAVGGAAQLFDFGPLMQNGGAVIGLANWTQDDGAGIDDRLVILGSSGDLAIYQGTDPASAANFANVGVWYIGQPPVGRRCMTNSGGNVYILTQFGVVPVAQITQGGLDNILTSDTDLLAQLRKLQSLLNTDFQTLLGTQGWELLELPSLALIQIARPSASVGEYIQYAFQQHQTAWSRIVDVPGVTFSRRLSEVYAGTADGRVLRVYSGSVDGVKLDGTGGTFITARVTPAFSYLGTPATNKQALMLRLNFVAQAVPGWGALMNTNFSITTSAVVPIPGHAAGSLWDVAFWDVSLWSGGQQAFGEWRGVSGIGYALSPSIFVTSNAPTTLASVEYMVKPGGPF
jgi:hypothetical protein